MIIKTNKQAFTMVEILVVLVLISCGLLPVYTMIRSGQQRISRADTRTIATMMGASVLELARTIGYDKAKNLKDDLEFQELQVIADRNGYIISEPICTLIQANQTSSESDSKTSLSFLKIKVIISSKHQKVKGTEIPDLVFVTILTNPRFNFY